MAHILALNLAIRENHQVEQRRQRREEINNSRLRKRTLRDMSDPFSEPERSFVGIYRLSRELARNLVNDMTPFMAAPRRATGVPIHLKVLAALQFYGQGCYQRPTGKSAEISVSQPTMSRIIEEVTDVLNQHFLRRWVKFPMTVDERRTIVTKNFVATNLPGTIGYVDGTHISIKRPFEREELYVNRKSYHSLNVQVVCDVDLLLLNIVARYPGATHDSFIWRFSRLRHVMEEVYRGGERCWLLGDSGYPEEPWLHTPILNAEHGTQEHQYTKRHMQARNRVERCIGVWKKRFRCLLKYRTLEYLPQKAGRIINACAILHNMCIKHRLPEPPPLNQDKAEAEQNAAMDENDEIQEPERGRQRGNRARDRLLNEGEQVRDRYLVRIQVVEHDSESEDEM